MRAIGLTSTTQRDDGVDYESDPEETQRSFVMRRRAASDDEEDRAADGGKEEGEGEGENVKRIGTVQSDESDGEGAAAEYDEEEYYSEGEEEEEYVEGGIGYREEGLEVVDGRAVADEVVRNERVLDEGGSEHVQESIRKEAGDVNAAADVAGDWWEDQREEDEENFEGKKQNEPFAVPTAGAFYMHDDRFRDSGGGRNRRTFGGRKLWESKDNRKWGHDKYEEMTIQERRYDEWRRGRGNYRGHGRNQAVNRGYPRGYGAKSYNNNQTVASTNTGNQNQVARSVRGRGPRRYEASFRKSSQAPSDQIKHRSMKSAEESLQDNAGQSVVSSMNREPDAASGRMQAFASSLNSASPPFYPSSSSGKDVSSAQRMDAKLSNASRISRPNVDNNFSVPDEPIALSQGKNIVNSIGIEKLSIDDSFAATAGKPLSSMSVTPVNGSQSLQNQNRAQIQGRAAVFPVGAMSYQPVSQGPVGRASPAMQVNFGQKGLMSNRVHDTTQQPGQRPGSGQNSSPSKVSASVNSYEIMDTDSPADSSKLVGALVPKEKSAVQGSGRGSVIYGGPPVVRAGGNTGVGHGDQNFPGTPAFLPVMQFSGQHPGGLGLPAVGMAFPGYVAQPQLGMGNSEMTWLPVLTGAAGALGAAYCPPYITVDGSYHASSGQTTSSTSSSKESHSNKPNNEWKPAQRPDIVNEDYGQRRNKPRRYSEMSFGQ